MDVAVGGIGVKVDLAVGGAGVVVAVDGTAVCVAVGTWVGVALGASVEVGTGVEDAFTVGVEVGPRAMGVDIAAGAQAARPSAAASTTAFLPSAR